MITLRNGLAVPTLVAAGLLAGITTPPAQAEDPTPEAKAVLAKVRDTYRNLIAYQFERVLLIEETQDRGKPQKVGELTLVTATDHARPAKADKSFPPLNLDRCRLEIKAKKGDLVLACDGGDCSLYTSSQNQYMKGKGFRDLNTSVGGSILLAFHLAPFSVLEEGAVQDAKVAREEEVEVGKERWKCYVIEGAIKPPADPTKPRDEASGSVDWLLSMLTLQGLIGPGRPTLYSPEPLGEKATGVVEPTRVVLWIDKDTHALVRSKRSAKLFKISPEGGAAGEKVEVAVTDSFTTASLKAPAADFFRFTPPEGAKEVPNVDSRREKK